MESPAGSTGVRGGALVLISLVAVMSFAMLAILGGSGAALALRAFGPLAAAGAAAWVLDLMCRRRGLMPPGFRRPWRRAAAFLVVTVILWIGIFEPLGSIGMQVKMDVSSIHTSQLFLLHILMVAAVAAWFLLGFAFVRPARPAAAVVDFPAFPSSAPPARLDAVSPVAPGPEPFAPGSDLAAPGSELAAPGSDLAAPGSELAAGEPLAVEYPAPAERLETAPEVSAYQVAPAGVPASDRAHPALPAPQPASFPELATAASLPPAPAAPSAAAVPTPSRPRFLRQVAAQLGLLAASIHREVGIGLMLGAGAWAAVLAALLLVALVLSALGGQDSLPKPSAIIPWIAGLPILVRLMVSLSAGFVEEIFFRGFLQPRVGIVLSTAFFVLAHVSYGQPFMLLGITLLSLIFAFLVRWRQTIWPAIAAHALFDGVQLLVIIPALKRVIPT